VSGSAPCWRLLVVIIIIAVYTFTLAHFSEQQIVCTHRRERGSQDEEMADILRCCCSWFILFSCHF
jgi:hypothetical protein